MHISLAIQFGRNVVRNKKQKDKLNKRRKKKNRSKKQTICSTIQVCINRWDRRCLYAYDELKIDNK